MTKIIQFLDYKRESLFSEVMENKIKYCEALENCGIYSACQEDINGLLKLLDTFFKELTDKYSISDIMSDNRGDTFIPASKFSSPQIHNGLEKMGLISEHALTPEGYDLITLYRKRKKLPTRVEMKEEIARRIIENSKKSSW